MATSPFSDTPRDIGVPERICVIDVGTNSVHALIVDVFPDGRFEVLERFKEMVRLGEGGLVHPHLSVSSMERAIQALGKVKALSDSLGAGPILAFATSAVREAENGAVLVQAIRETTGIELCRISGDREAILIFNAVRSLFDLAAPTLVVDIGGGSTEFIIGTTSEILFHTSLKIGAARLQQRFLTIDPLDENERLRLVEHVRETARPVFASVREHGVRHMIGSSGTIEKLVAAHATSIGLPADSVFSLPFAAEGLSNVLTRIAFASREKRLTLGGVDERRVDQIVAGALLLDVLIREGALQSVRVSPYALREGMVLYYQERLTSSALGESLCPGSDRDA